MGWADNYIKQLQAGITVKFRPRGNSMKGLIDDGQLVTVAPATSGDWLAKGSVVLCKVNGKQYLHKVYALNAEGKYQIGNNKGHVNGWTTQIYGVVTAVED